MDAIAQSLVPQREALNAELVARQVAPLPPFPHEVEDSRVRPSKRLQAAVQWCGQHMIGPDDIVWGLLPQELGDVEGYKAMVSPLLALQQVEPWMDWHRFLVRDRDPQPVIIPELDQVMALFQLGAIDFAFKRYPQALEEYGASFNYWDAKGEPRWPRSASNARATRCFNVGIPFRLRRGHAGRARSAPRLEVAHRGTACGRDHHHRGKSVSLHGRRCTSRGTTGKPEAPMLNSYHQLAS